MNDDILKNNQEKMDAVKEMFKEPVLQDNPIKNEGEIKKNKTRNIILTILLCIMIAVILFAAYDYMRDTSTGHSASGAIIGFIYAPLDIYLTIACIIVACMNRSKKKKK